MRTRWTNRLRDNAGALALAAMAGLGGCVDLQGLGGDQTPGASTSTAVEYVERDVEAPEVFQVTEKALWDGRPSLGGVWVAHPDAKDPERVVIRNEENGKFVIGALFRRERELPGPTIQVSSDAAAALGIVAGQPTLLNVTALRREKVPQTPPPEAAPPAEAEADVATAETAEPAGEDAAARAAEGRPALRPGSGAETTPAGAAAATAAAPAPKAKAPSKPGTAKARMTPEKITTESVAPLAATAAAAIARAEAGGSDDTARGARPAIRPEAKAPGAAAAPAPAADTTAKPRRPKSPLEKPFIQVGIFSIEDNARRTAELLRRNGVVPTILAQRSQGKRFWRVVIGPAMTASDRAAILRKVRELGFTDAYFVTD